MQIVRGVIKHSPGAVISTVQLSHTKGADGDGERRITGLANTPIVDRYNEVITLEALRDAIPEFKKNPMMLFMHSMANPIGLYDSFAIVESKRAIKSGLELSGTIGTNFEPAERAWTMAQQRILRAMSIGFIPHKWEMREIDNKRTGKKQPVLHYTLIELLENSLVSIPANSGALFTVDKGALVDVTPIPEKLNHLSDLNELIGACRQLGLFEHEQKHTVAWEHGIPQERGAPWDLATTYQRVYAHATTTADGFDFVAYRGAFAYVRNPDDASSYQFLHHDVDAGVLVVNLRACRAAIAALAGACGGADLPPLHARSVYDHLAQHVRSDFAETIPPLEDLQSLGDSELIIDACSSDTCELSLQDVELVCKAFAVGGVSKGVQDVRAAADTVDDDEDDMLAAGPAGGVTRSKLDQFRGDPDADPDEGDPWMKNLHTMRVAKLHAEDGTEFGHVAIDETTGRLTLLGAKLAARDTSDDDPDDDDQDEGSVPASWQRTIRREMDEMRQMISDVVRVNKLLLERLAGDADDDQDDDDQDDEIDNRRHARRSTHAA